MPRRRNGRRRRFPQGRRKIQPSGPTRRGVNSIAPRVSDGFYRLQDGLTLTSGSSGDCYITIDRSFSQFAESAPLSQLYTMVRLIGFDVEFFPLPNLVGVGSGGAIGPFVVGTQLAVTPTAPPDEKTVLACSDARRFNGLNRVTGFKFRSMVPRGGYIFTNFIDETSFSYAGSPGVIQFANTDSGSLPTSQAIFRCIITGMYEFTGRTYLSSEASARTPEETGKVERKTVRLEIGKSEEEKWNASAGKIALEDSLKRTASQIADS